MRRHAGRELRAVVQHDVRRRSASTSATSSPPGMEAFGVGAPRRRSTWRRARSRASGPPAGSFQENQPLFAFAGIGQGDVAITPLEMALVAAGIGNGGVMMTPHVGAEIRDADDDLVRRIDDEEWRTAVPPQVAQAVNAMMVTVVQNGTGHRGADPGRDGGRQDRHRPGRGRPAPRTRGSSGSRLPRRRRSRSPSSSSAAATPAARPPADGSRHRSRPRSCVAALGPK